MPKRTEIVNFLDNYLKIAEIQDNSLNGLQVEGRDNIKKIALAVDACQYVFEKAQSLGADMIIVHHGLFWKDTDPKIAGITKKRIKTLLESDISLYSAHLPLDLHPEVGNNACMAKLLNLKDLEPFGSYHEVNCGCYGKLSRDCSRDSFLKLVEQKIAKIRIKHLFGKKRIKTVGIVSGGGAFAVNEINKHNIDILISGEQQHMYYNPTKEQDANAIYLGHYDTETFGVKALKNPLKKKFKTIDTFFIDNPTGL